MKVRVTLKDPDSMADAVTQAARKEVCGLLALSNSERALILTDRTSDTYEAIASKWMRYGVYLCVEFDTETGTATVIQNSEQKQ